MGWGGLGDRQRSTERGRQKQEEMTETGVHDLSQLPLPFLFILFAAHCALVYYTAEPDLAYAKYAIIHQSKRPARTLNK